MSLKKRVEKLEDYEEAINPENLIILKVRYGGEPKPTEEEVKAAKKKFWEEPPRPQG